MPAKEHEYYVYIVASRSRTLYIGFTSQLMVRVFQHRAGTFEGFSKTYHCHRLVYFERFGEVEEAIAREKTTEAMVSCKETGSDRETEPDMA